MSKRNSKQSVKFTGAGHHIEAANMSVTCAVEEARKRGSLSLRDCEGLSAADQKQYVRLANLEFGVREWEVGT